ncbi:MAG: ABC transporter ATP-binding protein [Sphaerochaetaceae bacterium]|nr:ABC transporter ATP-binding protein [Spirochaetales bacterium]MDY5500293.1 ABC transporter ATP-binding protein [Sphaerochaetaceae bacterium]
MPKKRPSIMRTMVARVRQYKVVAAVTPLFMIGEVAMEVAIPTLMAAVIDRGVMKGDMSFILRMSVILVGSAILSLAFGTLGAFSGSRASTGFAANLRHDIFYRLQDFSFHNIDSFSQSSLITRLTTDVQNVQMAFQMVLRICFRAPVMLVFAMIMVVHNGGSLSVVFAIAIPFLSIALFLVMSHVHPYMSRAFKAYDKLNNVVQENLTGIRAVKAYVREQDEEKRFSVPNAEIHDNFVTGSLLMAWTAPLMMGTSYVCMIALAWLGAKAIVVRTTMTTGQLMSVLTYTMQILMNLMMISFIVIQLAVSQESARRITEVLDTESDMDPNPSGLKALDDGSIDFSHVDFAYNGSGKNLCLKDIDLHIRSGETIGILGNTGSGKSTLVSLIPRLYDVTGGSLSVGGHPVKEYDLHALRHEVNMVLQKNQLFSGTIASNIRWGAPEASDEEIWKALEIAGAADFVREKPDGLDSVVEQGGNNFSGGQKQRLCIARAIVGKPRILIFDDSTSAVDTKTDAKIREGLSSFAPETTKLIIAQRVSSVENADRIIILSDGRIQDIGTHSELLGRDKLYQALYSAQNKGVR